MDLLVTGDFLEASGAYRAGMISRLVGDYDECVAAVEGSFLLSCIELISNMIMIIKFMTLFRCDK